MMPTLPVLSITSILMFGSLCQLRQRSSRRQLVKVDLAGLQRRHRGLLVGDVLPDHPLELAPPCRRPGPTAAPARHVFGPTCRRRTCCPAWPRLSLHVNGPEPICALTCWIGSVSASFFAHDEAVAAWSAWRAGRSPARTAPSASMMNVLSSFSEMSFDALHDRLAAGIAAPPSGGSRRRNRRR